MKEHYIQRFLDEGIKAMLILKAHRMGYSLAVSELGAGTMLTFIRNN